MQRLLNILIWVMVSLFVTGCAQQAGVRYSTQPGYYEGPPPHAPAHGYRYKYRNHDLRYDSRLGAYVVIGWQDYYYHDGLYLHYLDGSWLFSARLDKDSHDWHRARREQIPPDLYRRHPDRDHNSRYDKKVPPGQAKKWEREQDDDYYDH